MRILIATDAWHPQVNGVVRSIQAMADEVRRLGATVDLLTPDGFTSVRAPTYPDIRLALASVPAVGPTTLPMSIAVREILPTIGARISV